MPDHSFTEQDLRMILNQNEFQITDHQLDELMSRMAQFSYQDLSYVKKVLGAHKEIDYQKMKAILLDVPLKSLKSSQVQSTTWDDIGGYSNVKRFLEQSIVWPNKYPERFKTLGISPSVGSLLYGPPGTGKTLIARAVASESGANFQAISIPDIIRAEVGESEKAIASVFAKAKQEAPSVIFIDEIESLFMARETSGDITSLVILINNRFSHN
jgi:SpoVK/Ycf46/Vps4 family AAA+-type ATPase